MPILSPDRRPPACDEKVLHPALVCAALRPHLSARRLQRIERVLSQRLSSLTVVLERPHDPHNGAAVLRSCEAMGLLHVHIIAGPQGFAFSRKVTQDAHKWLNVYIHQDTRSCLELLAHWGFSRLAAAPPLLGSGPRRVDLAQRQPIALVFGNEHAGLSEEALQLCDRRFHLPMYGFSESLNLSVSAALALSEAVGSRRAQLQRAGDLSAPAREQLRAAYYAASVRDAAALVWRRVRSGAGLGAGG